MKTPILVEQISTDLNPVEKTLLHENANIDEEIRLINEGAYGCIYYPGIKCNGRLENKQYITKIQKQTETTKNEQHISSRIQHIPSFRNYFAPILKQCKVKVAKKYVKNIKKCQVFRDETHDTIASSEYVSNKILFLGDETLKTYFEGIVSGKHVATSVKYSLAEGIRGNARERSSSEFTAMPLFFWKKIIETHIRLLQSIHRLFTANIIHMDIKPGNIMIEPIQKHPILIDFGISIDLTVFTPEKSFYIYETYTPWCLDILLCNYVVKKIGITNAKHTKVTEAEIDEVLRVFQYGSSTAPARNELFVNSIVSSATLDTFRENSKKYLIDTFLHPSKTWEDVYNHMAQPTRYSTWDSYGLSAMFLTLFDTIKQSNPDLFYSIETATRGTFMQKYVEILENSVFAVPEKRLDIKTTIDQLEELQKL
jgi:hypothetical protein